MRLSKAAITSFPWEDGKKKVSDVRHSVSFFPLTGGADEIKSKNSERVAE